jgi:hypothetical protein
MSGESATAEHLASRSTSPRDSLPLGVDVRLWGPRRRPAHWLPLTSGRRPSHLSSPPWRPRTPRVIPSSHYETLRQRCQAPRRLVRPPRPPKPEPERPPCPPPQSPPLQGPPVRAAEPVAGARCVPSRTPGGGGTHDPSWGRAEKLRSSPAAGLSTDGGSGPGRSPGQPHGATEPRSHGATEPRSHGATVASMAS